MNNLKNKLKEWLFKKEIENYEVALKVLMNELSEANEYMDIYEEELNKLERENRMLTMIVESLRLYDK